MRATQYFKAPKNLDSRKNARAKSTRLVANERLATAAMRDSHQRCRAPRKCARIREIKRANARARAPRPRESASAPSPPPSSPTSLDNFATHREDHRPIGSTKARARANDDEADRVACRRKRRRRRRASACGRACAARSRTERRATLTAAASFRRHRRYRRRHYYAAFTPRRRP